MLHPSSKLRWAVMALVFMATAMACNASDSDSASASSDDWDDAGTDLNDMPVQNEDGVIFGTLDTGGNGNGNDNGYGHKGCFEVALWCPSTGQALSPDPKNDCKYPPCP